MKKIELPKKYIYTEGETNPLYKRFEGWNKISHSQYTSFNDEDDDGYRGGYIGKYFLGEEDKGNDFAYFGNACGDYLNIKDQRVDEYLDDEDKSYMDKLIAEHEEGAEFEHEILIDLEPFGLEKTCAQGFSDKQFITKDGLTHIIDYKTANLDKKAEYYLSTKYKQLKLYGYGLEEIGYKIGDTYVVALGRKGNKLDKNALHRNGTTNMGIRLSGDVVRLDNPYDREEAIKAVQDVVETCIKISDYYGVYKKYFQ